MFDAILTSALWVLIAAGAGLIVVEIVSWF